MLLCPRDYLSTFLKVTTILVLALAILVILPPLRMPALTPFARLGEDRCSRASCSPSPSSPSRAGRSRGSTHSWPRGTTPKMIARESDARVIGYGGMLMESFVGVMAMIAACRSIPACISR